MVSMIHSARQSLLAALGEHETINVREVLAQHLERTLTRGELDAGRRAARRIAEDGDAVLMTMYPGQAEGERWQRRGSQAVLHLTVDHRVIKELPCRVELATEKWDAVIDEGMRLTQQTIESNPVLSSMLPGWTARPRAEARAAAMS
ncbi:hypothetical protein ACFVFJ_46170 [Streptomyces sp. NPDC057717]|uniref:hypothetical protein n=1 Tax=Streptomyces sp. NPDC057717 TaxID=3346224 RepID=UPI0036A63610